MIPGLVFYLNILQSRHLELHYQRLSTFFLFRRLPFVGFYLYKIVEMPLRPAKFSEHTALAEICSAAFFEEHLFGQTMHPNRHEHPEGLALYFHSFIRELWVDWRTKIIAAVAKDKMHDGKEKLVGVAIWQRQGEGGKKMEPSALDPRKL